MFGLTRRQKGNGRRKSVLGVKVWAVCLAPYCNRRNKTLDPGTHLCREHFEMLSTETKEAIIQGDHKAAYHMVREEIEEWPRKSESGNLFDYRDDED